MSSEGRIIYVLVGSIEDTYTCNFYYGIIDIKRRGSPKKVIEWWNNLSQWKQSIVHNAGLGDLVQLCRFRKFHKTMMNALAERWWDTTNTFHLPLGEVTLTPLNLYMLTGLKCKGSRLQYDYKLYVRQDEVQILLGSFLPFGPSIPLSWIEEEYSPNDVTEAQSVRCFILFLLGHTIFSNTNTTVHVHHLGYLKDLTKIGECDFGGAALAMLYRTMCDLSRDKLRSAPGFSWIWEGWLYELLRVNIPYRVPRGSNNPNIFPRLLRWYSGHCHQWNLVQYREELDKLTYHQVCWNAWEDSPALQSADGQAAMIMSSARLLLEGPCGYFWYLAERVTAQWMESRTQLVPAAPPRFMRMPQEIDDEPFIAAAMKGFPAMGFLNIETDYRVFCSFALRGPLVHGHIFPVPETDAPSQETEINAPNRSGCRRSTSSHPSNVAGGASSSAAPIIQLNWMIPTYDEQTDILTISELERTGDLEGPPLPENVTRVGRAEYDESRSMISSLKKIISKLTFKLRDATMCSRAKDVQMTSMIAQQVEMRHRLEAYEAGPSTSRRRRSTSKHGDNESSSASQGAESFPSNVPLARVASQRRRR